MSHAFLILCHRVPRHIATLALQYPEHHYYIHYDAKLPINQLDCLQNYHNIHILNNRINIHWGDFSMILATLNLMQSALAHKDNRYFHLMSGDCVPLLSPDALTAQMAQFPEKSVFLQCQNVPRLRHRARFNAPHADTRWQRSLIGKILTKIIQLADYLIPSEQIGWQGSQWFSADRPALQILFNESLAEPADYFAKKLVPDEHFFQYIVKMLPEQFNLVENNHRFIRFNHHANHPDFLNLDELWQARRDGYWFARKATPETLARFLIYEFNK